MKRTVKYPIRFLPREQLCERGRLGGGRRPISTAGECYPAFASSRLHPVPLPPQSGGFAAALQSFAGLYVDALA